jgi:hypothetical protein
MHLRLCQLCFSELTRPCTAPPPTPQSARSKAEKELRAAAAAGPSQEVMSPGASSMQQSAELAALRQQVGALAGTGTVGALLPRMHLAVDLAVKAQCCRAACAKQTSQALLSACVVRSSSVDMVPAGHTGARACLLPLALLQVTELRHHCQQANQARQAAEAAAATLQQQVTELQQHQALPGHSPGRGSHQHLEQQLKEMGEIL